jgi:hypothetical protein
MRRFFWLVPYVVLAACQLNMPGNAPATDAPVSPIVGEEIATTVLADGPDAVTDAAVEPEPASAGRVDDSSATGTAAIEPDVPPVEADGTAADAATATEEEDPAVGETDAATTTEEAAPVEEPEALKSAAQLLCERRGGAFVASAKGGPRTCVKRTRDSGKQCDQDRDCEGQCLARSRTCAPIDPLLGCNDVLQDNGARVSMCLN